jgi:very-short-patch-repair endonuclease
MEADEKRTSYLEHLGVRVLRFSDYDALTNTDGVIVEVLKAAGVTELTSDTAPPSP